MTDSTEFAYGDGLSALFGPDYVKYIPRLVEQGRVVSRPDDDFIFEWGSSAVGARAYIKSMSDGPREFVTAWPFASGRDTHAFTVSAISPDPDCASLRLISGSVQGVAITAFADCLAIDGGAAVIGETIDVSLHGWASQLQMAPTEPIVIQREDANDGLLETFRTEFERDGKLVIETSQMAAFLAHGSATSPLYEVQGEVRSIRFVGESETLLLAELQVLVARPDEGDGEFLLPVLLSPANWPGNLPAEGDHVRGLIWLQAAIKGATA